VQAQAAQGRNLRDAGAAKIFRRKILALTDRSQDAEPDPTPE
jgi:hypothetical protein